MKILAVQEEAWEKEILKIELNAGSSIISQNSDLILLSAQHKNLTEEILSLKSSNKRVVLVIEKDRIPLRSEAEFASIDGIIGHPFRLSELLNLARLLRLEQMTHEISPWMKTLTHLKGSMESVNALLEKIQRVHTPNRFNAIKGLKVHARHLSGMKPGGDFFDVFESPRKDSLNVILSDASSYGISSALLGLLLSSGAKIAEDIGTPVSEWIHALHKELMVTLGENGTLSLFLGRLQKRNLMFQYESYGSCEAFVVSHSGVCTRLKKSGNSLTSERLINAHSVFEIALQPKDRLIILSDGFVQGLGGEEKLKEVFQRKIQSDLFEIIDELTFQVKSKIDFKNGHFPAEDCTAIVLDVDSKLLRVA